MDWRSIDLNLLVVFDAVAHHGNVTRAAQALDLSQPATSAALARMRTLLGDPLFVKVGSEMRPTPRAAQIAPAVRHVLDTVKSEVLQPLSFDPATTERTFVVMTPDIGEVVFLPRLLARITAGSPRANLRTLSMPQAAAAEALETGAVDLAIGYYPDLQKAGFFLQRLFRNEHVCIVRAGHPVIGESMTLEQFLAASHVVVRPEGREHVFEQFLQARGVKRRVLLEVSHFMSLLPIVSASDLIATVPRHAAELCARHGEIRVVEAPVQAPVIDVHQFWHRRVQHDAAHVWLRRNVQELFGGG